MYYESLRMWRGVGNIVILKEGAASFTGSTQEWERM